MYHDEISATRPCFTQTVVVNAVTMFTDCLRHVKQGLEKWPAQSVRAVKHQLSICTMTLSDRLIDTWHRTSNRALWRVQFFPAKVIHTVMFSFLYLGDRVCFSNKRPRGLDPLLGHLLIKRIPVMFQLSSTKIPENLSQK